MSETLSAPRKRTQRPRLYAELVCDHDRLVDDDVQRGSMIVCHECGLTVRVRRVREARR